MLCGMTMQNENELVLVPRKPTRWMIESAYESALGEDAESVWKDMIEAYEKSLLDRKFGER
jgi:hypothetical protein